MSITFLTISWEVDGDWPIGTGVICSFDTHSRHEPTGL